MNNHPVDLKKVEPKVNTGLRRSRSDFGFRNVKRIAPSIKRQLMFYEKSLEKSKVSNEDRFNKVTILGDYRYNNSRLDEEIDINLGKMVKCEIKNNVDNKYEDLEHLLAQNLGERSKDVYDIGTKPKVNQPTLNINLNGKGNIIRVFPVQS
jgi:hypothetical protein